MEDHTLLTFIALAEGELSGRKVTVVPITDFLTLCEGALQSSGTETLLLPESDPPGACDPVDLFLRRLRIHPGYRPRTFLKAVPEAIRDGASPSPAREGNRDLPFESIAVRPFEYPGARFFLVEPGEQVTALDVLATASDEPDYGMDLDLFDESGTEWGRAYGFGSQPFGNPEHPFSSQAPFHMAFYHESPLLYRLAPGLRRTFLEYRIRQFSFLAGLAHQQGCAYWGYRFTGWALHYLQDVTMPYHASALPRRRTATVMLRGLLRAIGLASPYRRMIRDVTRRHVLLESLLLERLLAACGGGDPWNDPLVQAVCGQPEASRSRAPREIARVAAGLAPAADRALQEQERLGERRRGAPRHATSRRAPSMTPPLLAVCRAMLREFGRVTREFVAPLSRW